MAEVISLDLELLEKISAPAKRAADALRRIEQQQNKAQAAIEKANQKFADSWARVGMKAARDQERAIASSARASERATSAAVRNKAKEEAAIRRLGLAQLQAQKMNEKLDKNRQKHGGFLSSFREKLPFRSIGDYAKGAFWGHLAAEGVSKVIEGFAEGAKKAVEIVYDGIKEAFKAGAGYEQLKLNYKLLLGESGGKEVLEDIERFAGKTRYDGDEIAQMMRPLFNAGFRGTGARSAFAAAADLNAAGLGETQDFIDQITKIKLKGGVQAKQLVGMGVDVHAFGKSLAAALHTNEKTAMERAKEGTVDSQLLLNTIYEGIEKRQGGKLGTGAQAMGGTMGALWHKISVLPENFLKKMEETPAWEQIKERLTGVLASLDPTSPNGQRIMGALMRGFQRLADAIGRVLTEENIDKFSAGVEKAIEFATKLPEVFGSLLSIAKTIAAVWAGSKAINAIGAGGSAAEKAAESVASKGLNAAGKALGVGAGTVAIAATAGLLAEPDKQAEQFDDLNEQMVKEGKRRKIEHWWGDTYEDVPESLQSRGGVNVSTNVGGITINVAEGTDPKAVAEQVGSSVTKAQEKSMERAAQERGAR